MSFAQEAHIEYNNNTKYLYNPANIGYSVLPNHAGIHSKLFSFDSMPSNTTVISGSLGTRLVYGSDIRYTEGVNKNNYQYNLYGKQEVYTFMNSRLHIGERVGLLRNESYNSFVNASRGEVTHKLQIGAGVLYSQALHRFYYGGRHRIVAGAAMRSTFPGGKHNGTKNEFPFAYNLHLEYVFSQKKDKYYTLLVLYQDLDTWLYNTEDLEYIIHDDKQLLISAMNFNKSLLLGFSYKHNYDQPSAYIANVGYKLNKEKVMIHAFYQPQLQKNDADKNVHVMHQLSVAFYFKKYYPGRRTVGIMHPADRYFKNNFED